MNRFATKTDRSLTLPHMNLTLIACPILIILFLTGIYSLGSSTVSKQQESLETALNRDITHCYAVEGMYPPSLDYLEEHYGLTYDKELFFVNYRPIGSNIRPDVTIIVKE